MNKMRLFVGGVCIVLNCAPAFSQGASPSPTNSNYKGLQNLVDNVNSGQAGSGGAGTGSGAGAGGRAGHKWKGGPAGAGNAGGATSGSASGATGGTASPIGAGAGATGSGGDDKEARRAERRAKMMQRFDLNGDGQLDANEQAKFDAFKAERKARRQAQMANGGQGGGLGGQAGQGTGIGGPGAAGVGGKLGGGHHRKMMQGGGQNQSADSSPSLPGGRRGGPGDFPKGFPDGSGGASPSPTNP